MQDIDFDALDQAVHKIMDQKKQAAEHKARVRRQQGRGRNMDIVNVAHRPKSQAATKPVARPAAHPAAPVSQSITTGRSNRTSQGPIIDAIRRPASAKQVASTQPQVVVKTVAPTKTAAVAESPVQTPAIARGANLLRQRRRLNQAGEAMMSAVAAPLEKAALKPSDALIKGHYQSETLSTKQADGSETVYQYDSVDYVAKVTPEAVAQEIEYRKARSLEPVASSNVIDLDAQAQAHKAVTREARIYPTAELPVSDQPRSPFLDTAKVDKRPLGVPYDKAASDYQRATLQVESTADEQPEPALYRGDLTTEDAPRKTWHSIIWLFLMILAIVGAAVGIYLMTVYNK